MPGQLFKPQVLGKTIVRVSNGLDKKRDAE